MTFVYECACTFYIECVGRGKGRVKEERKGEESVGQRGMASSEWEGERMWWKRRESETLPCLVTDVLGYLCFKSASSVNVDVVSCSQETQRADRMAGVRCVCFVYTIVQVYI